jgi:Na+/H+ antiporter NhaA
VGILAGSIISGIGGYLLLKRRPSYSRDSQPEFDVPEQEMV